MSDPSEPRSDRALPLYVAGIFVTIAAMILAFTISRPDPVVVVVDRAGGVTTVAASGAPAASAAPAVAPVPAPKPPAAPPVIRVIEAAAAPAIDDPFDPQWDSAPALDVPLQPQTVTRPMLPQATITSVRVQGIRGGGRIVWRLSWAAAKPAWNVDAGRFCDAVAMQFPLQPNTPFTMGGPGQPVHILHWKALWQKDIDEHFQQTEDLHPNYHADFYWFATGSFPFPVTTALASAEARQFMPALAAGNPMANPARRTPIEEIVAEGFGTATTTPATPSNARGVWKDGRWTIVIDRPLAGDDPLAAAIQSGQADAISFAVWDGSAQNVGGRKQWSGWVPLKLVAGSAAP